MLDKNNRSFSWISARMNHLGYWTRREINGLFHPCSSWCTFTNQGVSTGDPEISTVERSPKLPTFPPPTGRHQPKYHPRQNSIAINFQDAASYIFVSITQVYQSKKMLISNLVAICFWMAERNSPKDTQYSLETLIFGRFQRLFCSGCGKRGVLRRVSPTLRSQTLPANSQGTLAFR